MVVIKKTNNTSVGKDVDRKEPYTPLVELKTSPASVDIRTEESQKSENSSSYDTAVILMGVSTRQRYLLTDVYCSTVHNSQVMEPT